MAKATRTSRIQDRGISVTVALGGTLLLWNTVLRCPPLFPLLGTRIANYVLDELDLIFLMYSTAVWAGGYCDAVSSALRTVRFSSFKPCSANEAHFCGRVAVSPAKMPARGLAGTYLFWPLIQSSTVVSARDKTHGTSRGKQKTGSRQKPRYARHGARRQTGAVLQLDPP